MSWQPVFFPGTHATPFLSARPLPRSSASNKQPLINHALLITPAPLSALEIDPLCALLLPDTPGFCPSHLPRHRRLQLVSPLRPALLFPIPFLLLLLSSPFSLLVTSHHIPVPRFELETYAFGMTECFFFFLRQDLNFLVLTSISVV